MRQQFEGRHGIQTCPTAFANPKIGIEFVHAVVTYDHDSPLDAQAFDNKQGTNGFVLDNSVIGIRVDFFGGSILYCATC